MASSAGESDTPNITNVSTSCELESQLTFSGFGKFNRGHVMILQDKTPEFKFKQPQKGSSKLIAPPSTCSGTLISGYNLLCTPETTSMSPKPLIMG